MVEDDLDLIRNMHRQMSGRDLAAPAENPAEERASIGRVYTPDVEVRWPLTNPEARVYRGHDGLMRAFDEWTSAFDEYYIDASDFRVVGDLVLATTRQRGIGSRSGAEIDMEVFVLYRLEDGKISRHWEFDSLEDAPEAARASSV